MISLILLSQSVQPNSTDLKLVKYIYNKIQIIQDHWIWRGSVCTSGYGTIGLAKYKNKLAHRIMYEICYGSIFPGYDIAHECDIKLCINPFHLVMELHSENMAAIRLRGKSKSIDPEIVDMSEYLNNPLFRGLSSEIS